MTTQACATVFDTRLLELEDINSPELREVVNRAREESNTDKSIHGIQKQKTDNAQEKGQQESEEGEVEEQDMQPTMLPTKVSEQKKQGEEGHIRLHQSKQVNSYDRYQLLGEAVEEVPIY